jgi:hypothetical protein
VCLAIPGQILEVTGVADHLAKVEVAGVRRNVNVGFSGVPCRDRRELTIPAAAGAQSLGPTLSPILVEGLAATNTLRGEVVAIASAATAAGVEVVPAC